MADAHHLVLGHVVDLLAVDEDLAAVRLEQAEDQPQDRRLAGAAGAEEDLRVPGLQREADVVEDDLLVEGQAHVIEDDNRPAGAERFVEQFRTWGRLGARHQYINTMRSWVTR